MKTFSKIIFFVLTSFVTFGAAIQGYFKKSLALDNPGLYAIHIIRDK